MSLHRNIECEGVEAARAWRDAQTQGSFWPTMAEIDGLCPYGVPTSKNEAAWTWGAAFYAVACLDVKCIASA
jgi:hypothetical protein